MVALGLVAGAQTNNMHAPEGTAKTITFAASDVQYWVGSGSNQCVVVFGWDDDYTALAWGFRWSGTLLVQDMLEALDSADSRLSLSIGGGLVSNISYNDGMLDLQPTTNWWCYTVNGDYASAVGSQTLSNGDMVEFSDDCSFSLDEWYVMPVSDPNATSPVDASIDTTAIRYWVGQGSNRAIMAVNWADPDTCLAWGIRFNGTISSIDALDTIARYDSRFWPEVSMYLDDIHFIMSNGDTLGLSAADPAIGYNYWWINIDGVSGNVDEMHDGTFAKYGDPNSGTGYDYMFGYYMNYAWSTAVTPVPNPNDTTVVLPTDATIAASNILYWVGEGQNQMIMAVNWADPDTCLAWGFRFSEDSVTLQQVMNAIDTADPRFSYVAGQWGVDDILFTAGADTLRLSASENYNYWWSNLNGSAAQYSYDALYIHNNDFVKWGDSDGGIALAYDEWGYASELVWTTTVTPVSVPADEPIAGPYDGAVGTEGCLAIAHDDARITNWATTCTLERGYQDIATAQTLVSYGNESDACGAVTESANMAVVSLGDGGKATLTFDGYITNGEGPDFCVFENSFNDSFLELAFVEVSSDGENFFRFPAVSLTQTETQISGTGSVDPTYLYNLAGKYRSLWGVGFDLDELAGTPGLDVDHVTHVRIVDVVGSLDPQYGSTDSQGNLVNDPYPTNSYSGGFDLDGIGVLNFLASQNGIATTSDEQVKFFPNPASNSINCQFEGEAEVVLYDMTGRIVMAEKAENGAILSVGSLPRGIYMLRIGETTSKVVLK